MHKKMSYLALAIILAILVSMVSISTLAQIPSSASSETDLPTQLGAGSDEPDWQLNYHPGTQKVRFLNTKSGDPIQQPGLLPPNATPETAALNFLIHYGEIFGLNDPANELVLMKTSTLGDAAAGEVERSFVRYQQVHAGIPVLGGELILQMDANKDVLSVNGEVLPDLDLDTTPTVDSETAWSTALAKVAKDYDLSVSELTASQPELWIYNPVLLGGPGPRFDTLVWRLEVESVDLLPIRELVLVDARLGNIALHFNQIDTAKQRQTYDANNTTTLPGTLRCDESNPTCSGGDAHEVAAHVFAGDTYDFFNSEHSRDGIDDAGMTMISTVHYGVNFENAFWDGSQMVYGDGAGFPLADDVVAHELTHGVTEHESNLFYYYQSGAINESLSDIWGEFVDQYGATGNDADGDIPWEMGEDIEGWGAIRDMADPTSFGDPDKMTSPNYYCAQTNLGYPDGDNGGVHSNSGIGNKTAYLMTDGDSFNGKTVTGLGYAKVADLFYEVQTNLLTSAADYADLYDALLQACTNLGYSASDCQEVKDAVDATEMNLQPSSCQAPEAPICPAGQSPSDIFFDNIESGAGNWTSGSIQGTIYWYLPQTSAPFPGFNIPYATSGVGNVWGFNQGSPIGGTSDTFLAMNSNVPLPANAYMHFNHSFGFESDSSGSPYYDGGVLEYSTNSGGSWSDAGSLFTYNGYNNTIDAVNGNPLGGRSAFTADSRGYISSRLDLNSLAGQDVRFRFRIGTDAVVYDYGWFIDDVRIYTCSGANNPPHTPSSPSPIDGATNQSINVNVSWVGGDPDGDSVTYDVYFEAGDPTPDVLLCDDTSSQSCDPGTISSSTQYYWQVISKDQHAETTSGPVWDFTTGTQINNMIYLPLVLKNVSGASINPPTLQAPGDGTTTSDSTPTFQWSTSTGATQYQIQVDNNADFSSPERDQTQPGTTYTPASALSDGTYNWRVRAGNGSIWSSWSSVWTVTINTAAIPLLNGDFESGPTNWTEYSYNGWLLILQESAMPVDAHSGIWAVWLGGSDDEISYIEQTVTVPPASPHFTYWHWIESEDLCGYDYGGVVVNGSTVVDVYDLCSAENTSGWVLHSVDLSAYVGQTIPVQIRVETDVAWISNVYVDDVSFESSPASPSFIASPGFKVFAGPKSDHLLKHSGEDSVEKPRVFQP